MNTQPKATRLPPLVPEFKQVIQVSGAPNMLPSNDTIRLEQDFHLSSSVVSPIRVIPQQSKLFKTGSILAGSVKGGYLLKPARNLSLINQQVNRQLNKRGVFRGAQKNLFHKPFWQDTHAA